MASASPGPAVTARRLQPRQWALLLFIVPLVSAMYPPPYHRAHLSPGGVPFFVWYQLAVVVTSAAVTGAVYRLRGTGRG